MTSCVILKHKYLLELISIIFVFELLSYILWIWKKYVHDSERWVLTQIKYLKMIFLLHFIYIYIFFRIYTYVCVCAHARIFAKVSRGESLFWRGIKWGPKKWRGLESRSLGHCLDCRGATLCSPVVPSNVTERTHSISQRAPGSWWELLQWIIPPPCSYLKHLAASQNLFQVLVYLHFVPLELSCAYTVVAKVKSFQDY